MAFITAALDTVREPEPVPEGTYELQVKTIEAKDSSKGNPMLVVTFKILDSDYPNAFPVRHWFQLPYQGKDPDVDYQNRLELKRFLKSFSIPEQDGGFDTDDAIGQVGTVRLIQQTNEEDNLVFNRIRFQRAD
jgi:hypothetical protein